MKIVKIPILPPSQNVDEIGLKGFGAKMYDAYIDEFGNMVGRPGLKAFVTLGTSAAVDGLYWWDEQSMAIAVSNGNAYKITAADGTFSQLTATNDSFQAGTRVTFANFGTNLYAANGAKILKIGTTSFDNIADDTANKGGPGNAPTVVTHVAVLDRFLIANEDATGNFHWSDVGAPETWSAYDSEAEGQPDNLISLGVAELELYLGGKRTMEMWRNDGSTPFIRELQGYVESGMIAAYSFTRCENYWYWLDNRRRVVRLVGRVPQSISGIIDKYISAFSVVTDALGDFILVDGRPFLVLTFKSESVTLAFDLKSGHAYEWSYWENSTHKHWRGNCACVATAWNKTLIGDHSNGKVYELDSSTYQDDSSTLRRMYRTEHINHGNESLRKVSRKMVVRVKRTNEALAGDVVDMVVKWRDNGKTSWGNERTITLGQVGDTEFRGYLNGLGSYYSRQWEFYVTGDAALTISSIEEHIDTARF